MKKTSRGSHYPRINIAAMFINKFRGYLSRVPLSLIERENMKVPHLRIVGISAATAALAVGLSATAADAVAVSSSHASSTAASSTAVSTAATAPGTMTSTVAGTFKNADGTGNFAGTFTPQKFTVTNGVLEATGLLKGTLTDANGTKLGTVSQTATVPVNTKDAAADPGCNILNLTLGPLNLNLLGLVVTLNQVHLTITAVPGIGNLLGNLLCDVANLLNGGGALSAISTLLNSILALL
jgi:hypothetical protein